MYLLYDVFVLNTCAAFNLTLNLNTFNFTLNTTLVINIFSKFWAFAIIFCVIENAKRV